MRPTERPMPSQHALDMMRHGWTQRDLDKALRRIFRSRQAATQRRGRHAEKPFAIQRLYLGKWMLCLTWTRAERVG